MTKPTPPPNVTVCQNCGGRWNVGTPSQCKCWTERQVRIGFAVIAMIFVSMFFAGVAGWLK